MKKDLINDDAFYIIVWSQNYKYDKYSLSRILPEMSGICALMTIENGREIPLMFYASWRDGLRMSMRKLMDPDWPIMPEITAQLDPDNLYYKYTIIESNIKDLMDIMYWLIRTYEPPYNDPQNFKDSGRYMNINIKEQVLKQGEVMERFGRAR